ncbi:BrxA family protein [Lacihabitans soyangensis]|uniref:DUF1819 family protein n=1 Tax=Lacihabitans soyangensis TaxID=869394 RepID=A0AAE3KTJ0_9BACT|nr:BrxA family protein [Lacihabitans soyangensis]MCP9762291.1 DUF1819 family protein [Lacihabitans soyangensis]
MTINTDINILGGLPDWNLVNVFLQDSITTLKEDGTLHTYSSIKTDKSVKRFEKTISTTLIHFLNKDVELLLRSLLKVERISKDSLQLLFWNASLNNDLLNYLNSQIYFLAFYSGRISIKQDEVLACLKDLKERETELQNWSISTLETTASKYLTLLKKFGLMGGSLHKSILHPYLSDKMFVVFVYWLKAIETKSNLMESAWLKYAFCEIPVLIDRLMQKKFATYFLINFTGDNLKIETTIPYETIYDALK